mmetsp:Transcript_45465/g.88813  ORF Transcript_45465/g.88813 Transcript_45465/m.88813 type:complete len:125 (-) Transcript_45465:312-686(-)
MFARAILPRAAVAASSRLSAAAIRPAPLWAIASPVRAFATTFLDPSEVSSRVVEVVKAFDKVDPGKVNDKSTFSADLGLDSLDAVEVVMAIEDEFAIEIPDAEADGITGIEDAVAYIAGHPMAK